MKKRIVLPVLLLIVSLESARASDANQIPISTGTEKNSASDTMLASRSTTAPEISDDSHIPVVDLKGWEHVARLFELHGVSRARIHELFLDPRLPKRDNFVFALKPRESHFNYRKHNTAKNRKHALEFYREHEASFKRAEAKYGVPAEVMLSILQVETFCGKNTGRSGVFYPLVRLASAATPANLEINYSSHVGEAESKRRIGNTEERKIRSSVQTRAQWLESTFLPHAVATVKLAEQLGVSVWDLRGSSAGALGMPQFLPGNTIEYGVDGNGDGKVDLFSAEDAIPSVANFLRAKGWTSKNISKKAQRSVIWEYNRSIPYIDTVLGMAAQLRSQLLAKKPARSDHRA